MAAILGLMTAEQISAYRPKNVRRSVFYMYPNERHRSLDFSLL